MPLAEVLPAVQSLSHGEKVELMNWLSAEIGPAPQASGNGLTPDLMALLPPPGAVLDYWSPFDAHASADALLRTIPCGTAFELWKPNLDADDGMTVERFVAGMSRQP